MDLSKLNSNEKMAGLGAVLAIFGSIVSFGAGPYGLLTGNRHAGDHLPAAVLSHHQAARF